MHLGQTVQFLDWRDGQMRSGKVVEMRDTQVVLHELATRREWKLPYAAIEPIAADAAPVQPDQQSRPRYPCRSETTFAVETRWPLKILLNTQVGTIARINQRTATIDAGSGDNWRVGFALLRHVVDL